MEHVQLDESQCSIVVSAYVRINFIKPVPRDVVMIIYWFWYQNIINIYIEKLKQIQPLTYRDMQYLSERAYNIFMEEPNIIPINLRHAQQLIVVGNVAAQLYDLIYCIFERFGYPSDDINSPMYLFLGNYVHRGHYKVETISLLLALKVKYPSKVILLRGKHECRQTTQVYGLADQCLQYYHNNWVWNKLCSVFDMMPLCALINNEIFAVHSGLSPMIENFQQIDIIDRNQEIPHTGEVCDLMWAIPEEGTEEWGIVPKGAGYMFGSHVVNTWCKVNKIKRMIVSAQLVMEGYRYMFDSQLLNIFSAPNYCYRCGNVGGVAIIDSNSNVECKIYNALPDEQRVGPNGKHM